MNGRIVIHTSGTQAYLKGTTDRSLLRGVGSGKGDEEKEGTGFLGRLGIGGAQTSETRGKVKGFVEEIQTVETESSSGAPLPH